MCGILFHILNKRSVEKVRYLNVITDIEHD